MTLLNLKSLRVNQYWMINLTVFAIIVAKIAPLIPNLARNIILSTMLINKLSVL